MMEDVDVCVNLDDASLKILELHYLLLSQVVFFLTCLYASGYGHGGERERETCMFVIYSGFSWMQYFEQYIYVDAAFSSSEILFLRQTDRQVRLFPMNQYFI